MAEALKLLCILAHPDDETLGNAGMLAKYAAEGVKTYLITATRGEQGWFGPEGEYPGPTELGRIRERELYAAARVLGVHEVVLLDYLDGELDQADPHKIIPELVGHLRRIRPQVIITFDPYGAYGHPDHIAICQFATSAVVAAADASNGSADSAPLHTVSKLYYMAETKTTLEQYESAFGELVMNIDGEERRARDWPEWSITARIDTTPYFQQIWDAIGCHRSQLPGYETLLNLPETFHRELWSSLGYYRAFSLVNSGRSKENDLFEGLR
jgi:LmbE family N-acetylglucosaminyl deacetylase